MSLILIKFLCLQNIRVNISMLVINCKQFLFFIKSLKKRLDRVALRACVELKL